MNRPDRQGSAGRRSVPGEVTGSINTRFKDGKNERVYSVGTIEDRLLAGNILRLKSIARIAEVLASRTQPSTFNHKALRVLTQARSARSEDEREKSLVNLPETGSTIDKVTQTKRFTKKAKRPKTPPHSSSSGKKQFPAVRENISNLTTVKPHCQPKTTSTSYPKGKSRLQQPHPTSSSGLSEPDHSKRVLKRFEPTRVKISQLPEKRIVQKRSARKEDERLNQPVKSASDRHVHCFETSDMSLTPNFSDHSPRRSSDPPKGHRRPKSHTSGDYSPDTSPKSSSSRISYRSDKVQNRREKSSDKRPKSGTQRHPLTTRGGSSGYSPSSHSGDHSPARLTDPPQSRKTKNHPPGDYSPVATPKSSAINISERAEKIHNPTENKLRRDKISDKRSKFGTQHTYTNPVEKSECRTTPHYGHPPTRFTVPPQGRKPENRKPDLSDALHKSSQVKTRGRAQPTRPPLETKKAKSREKLHNRTQASTIEPKVRSHSHVKSYPCSDTPSCGCRSSPYNPDSDSSADIPRDTDHPSPMTMTQYSSPTKSPARENSGNVLNPLSHIQTRLAEERNELQQYIRGLSPATTVHRSDQPRQEELLMHRAKEHSLQRTSKSREPRSPKPQISEQHLTESGRRESPTSWGTICECKDVSLSTCPPVPVICQGKHCNRNIQSEETISPLNERKQLKRSESHLLSPRQKFQSQTNIVEEPPETHDERKDGTAVGAILQRINNTIEPSSPHGRDLSPHLNNLGAQEVIPLKGKENSTLSLNNRAEEPSPQLVHEENKPVIRRMNESPSHHRGAEELNMLQNHQSNPTQPNAKVSSRLKEERKDDQSFFENTPNVLNSVGSISSLGGGVSRNRSERSLSAERQNFKSLLVDEPEIVGRPKSAQPIGHRSESTEPVSRRHETPNANRSSSPLANQNLKSKDSSSSSFNGVKPFPTQSAPLLQSKGTVPDSRKMTLVSAPKDLTLPMRHKIEEFLRTVNNKLLAVSSSSVVEEKESLVKTMEEEVRSIQKELELVQAERRGLELQKKLLNCASADPNVQLKTLPPGEEQATCPATGGACPNAPPHQASPPKYQTYIKPNQGNQFSSEAEAQLSSLREQYRKLQMDYNNKLEEVSMLRVEYDSAKRDSAALLEKCKEAEARVDDLLERLKGVETEKIKIAGSKDQMIELEQQLIVAKQRYTEGQEELEEMRTTIAEQLSILEDYRNKYLNAQQTVEEQRRQIDIMEIENNRISEQVNLEIQRIKNQFQEKLQELTPLPDLLKTTQLKLQEAQQLRLIAERHVEQLRKDYDETKEQNKVLELELEAFKKEAINSSNEQNNLQTSVTFGEKKLEEFKSENAKLRQAVARLEEVALNHEKRYDEKTHEALQLATQLETLREESARQVSRTKDRCEVVRKSLQNQICQLESLLAQSRAAASTAQKDRDEIRMRMQAQINSLNENFEQAQLRIRGLQSHVNYLKNSYTNIFAPPENQIPFDAPPHCL